MESLGIHSDLDALEDYFERFEVWAMTKEDAEGVNIVAHFLTFIGEEAYSLLRTLAMPGKPISLPYTTLKELLLDHVKYTNFERNKGRFRKVIHEDIKNSGTLLRHPDPVHTQGCVYNSLKSCNSFHENGHNALYEVILDNIQSVCNTNVHLTATNIKSCNSDSTESSIHNDHLSLSTILKDNIESYNSSELNEIQSSCETTVLD
ncbi:unnamed protein product [Schistosoma curassoni]|uniref:Uncharacterized protein n=1 Tax=Schistosoma curassoni TaxID=6186 RepID=A0A183K2E5_9TREM|nr:unnamed protein product [Schistosoma curassoni]